MAFGLTDSSFRCGQSQDRIYYPAFSSTSPRGKIVQGHFPHAPPRYIFPITVTPLSIRVMKQPVRSDNKLKLEPTNSRERDEANYKQQKGLNNSINDFNLSEVAHRIIYFQPYNFPARWGPRQHREDQTKSPHCGPLRAQLFQFSWTTQTLPCWPPCALQIQLSNPYTKEILATWPMLL